MCAYNIVHKIKHHTKKLELDFKSTIRKLSTISTVVNTINKAIKFETIPKVSDDIQSLFDTMGLKFPTKI